MVLSRAPEERNMVLSHTIEPVGVGFPNPSSEATPPLRCITHLEFWCIVGCPNPRARQPSPYHARPYDVIARDT